MHQPHALSTRGIGPRKMKEWEQGASGGQSEARTVGDPHMERTPQLAPQVFLPRRVDDDCGLPPSRASMPFRNGTMRWAVP